MGGKANETSRGFLAWRSMTCRNFGVNPKDLPGCRDIFGRVYPLIGVPDWVTEDTACGKFLYSTSTGMPDEYITTGAALGDQLLLWAVMGSRRFFECIGDPPLSPYLPLWRQASKLERWRPDQKGIPNKIFVVSEQGCKARPANAGPVELSIVGQVLRTAKEEFLYRDSRLLALPSAWDFATRLDSMLPFRVIKDLAILSSDLTQASDLLHPDLLEEQVQALSDLISPNHFLHRIYPAVALGARHCHIIPRYWSEGMPLDFRQKRGTLLGDPTSYVELNMYVLNTVEIAEACGSEQVYLSHPIKKIFGPGRHRHADDLTITGIVGDDKLQVGRREILSLSDRILIDAHGKPSPGKNFISTRIGFFLEEAIDITSINQEPKCRYIDTIKLRLLNSQSSGSRIRDRYIAPIFGKLEALQKRVSYLRDEGKPSLQKLGARLAWHNFQQVRSLVGSYPVHLPQTVGGLSLPTWGGFLDNIEVAPKWYWAMAQLAKDGNNSIREAINNFIDLEAHGAVVNRETLMALPMGTETSEVITLLESSVHGYKTPLTGAGHVWYTGLRRDIKKACLPLIDQVEFIKRVRRAKRYKDLLFSPL